MRLALIFVLISVTPYCFAQGDDFPDYRSKKEIFTRIPEKDIRADIASYSMGGMDESIGKVPLKSIPIVATGPNFITFEGNTLKEGSNIRITITTGIFDPKKHKLGYYDKFLTKIDNKPYFGDYGKVPKTTIESISVVVDRDSVIIPQTAFVDLYNPILSFTEGGVQKSQNKVYLSGDGHKIYIYMLKPERGGSYEVTWVIQDKKYLRRVVDFGFLK
jgi:hypothetical protein